MKNVAGTGVSPPVPENPQSSGRKVPTPRTLQNRPSAARLERSPAPVLGIALWRSGSRGCRRRDGLILLPIPARQQSCTPPILQPLTLPTDVNRGRKSPRQYKLVS